MEASLIRAGRSGAKPFHQITDRFDAVTPDLDAAERKLDEH